MEGHRLSRKVYIAHPLQGESPDDISSIYHNIDAVSQICRDIVAQEPLVIPLSPIHAFSFCAPIGDQSSVLDLCLSLLTIADELRVYGDWESSKGCKMEIAHARRLGIPVIFTGWTT